MIRPERRTRGDLLAALAITVTVAVATVLIWWTSDARATISRPAATPAVSTPSARTVPATLDQLWTADSPKTTTPVVVEGTVVTGSGHDLVGHDPTTGVQRWLFARDSDLCGVTSLYNLAVAVYPDSRGCGQVSTVDGLTGQRGPTRTGYSDKQIELSTDGTAVLAAGSTRVELWRSDMVRTLAWGPLDAPVNPPVQPQPPCTFVSTAASADAVAILQACPNVPDLRLAMLKVAKEDVTPDQKWSQQTGLAINAGAKVLTVADSRAAVYRPTPQPSIVVYDDAGAQVSVTPLPKPSAPAAVVSRAGGLITYWTGDSVVVFDGTSLTYRYTIGASPTATPIGPGVMMANKLLIPVINGMAVFDPSTGQPDHVIPVNRPGVSGPIVPGVAGTTVLEQRGDQIVALGQRK